MTVITKPRKVKRVKTSSILLSCPRPTHQTTTSSPSLTTTTTPAPLEVQLYTLQTRQPALFTTHYTQYGLYLSLTHYRSYTLHSLLHTTNTGLYSRFTHFRLDALRSLPQTTHIIVFTQDLHITDFIIDLTHQRLCLSLRDYLDVFILSIPEGCGIILQRGMQDELVNTTRTSLKKRLLRTKHFL